MKTLSAVIALLIMLLVVHTACGVTTPVAHASSSASSDGRASFSECTDVQTRTFICRDEHQSLRLTVRPRLSRGRVAWVLLDPLGQIRWTSEARAPHWFGRTLRFEPVPGEWKLKVAVVQASGEYSTSWRAE